MTKERLEQIKKWAAESTSADCSMSVADKFEELFDALAALEAERDVLRKVLEQIADPLGVMIQEVRKNSELRLDGPAAIALANDPHFLSDIAKKALRATAPATGEEN